MTTFAQRMGGAVEWEQRLLDALRGHGWLAYPFGQGQLPDDDVRDVLKEWRDDYGRPTMIRWLPDIIAVRPGPKPIICLVDAKTDTRSDTGNYSVEIHSVDAGLVIVNQMNAPLYYVWPDLGVLTPHMVVNRHHHRDNGVGAGGSGTSFYLVSKRCALQAQDVFIPKDPGELVLRPHGLAG